MKTLITAAIIAVSATTVVANPLTKAESLGKCVGIAQTILDNFSIDIMLSDKWNNEKLTAIVDISFDRLFELEEATTEGMGSATTKAVKERMGEKFDYGILFGGGFANAGGLNNATEFMLNSCK